MIENSYMRHVLKHLNKNAKYILVFCSVFVAFNMILHKNTNSLKFETSSYGIVQYPVFEDVENSEEINNIIIDKVKSIVPTDEDVDGIIQFSVLECNSNIISVEFYGDIIYLSAKNPYRVYSCISIDITKNEQIKLNDIVNVDSEFVEEYRESLCVKYKELHPDTNNNPFCENGSITVEYLKEHLISADEVVYNDYLERYLDASIKSCLSGDNLILSLELPQAFGYHIEVEIPIDSLNR